MQNTVSQVLLTSDEKMSNYQLRFRIHNSTTKTENNWSSAKSDSNGVSKSPVTEKNGTTKSVKLTNGHSKKLENEERPPLQIVWLNVYLFCVLHLVGFYGLYRCLTGTNPILNIILVYFSGLIGELGITAGPHRLWTHRSYKAKLPLRILLAFMNASAAQNSIYIWTRDHRVHHKWTETNADPHNAKRGFFFAHMGWLMCKKHPDVTQKGKTIDITDVWDDPVIRWQYKYFIPLVLLCCFTLPTLFHYYVLGFDLSYSFCFGAVWRYLGILHITWLVNSAAHIYGSHPYDDTLHPAENRLVAFLAAGEGWHNYHHVFPWDYKTSELGFWRWNVTTMFIDFFAAIGWAYDLKTVSRDVIKQRVTRTGDGSHWEFGGGGSSPTDGAETVHPYEKPLPFM